MTLSTLSVVQQIPQETKHRDIIHVAPQITTGKLKSLISQMYLEGSQSQNDS